MRARPWESTKSVMSTRARAGARRVRVSLPKILLATVGAVFSYWFAETVLGHQQPIFAATSAMISLNFASTSHVRRTLEVAIGCTLGIAMGDALISVAGRGLWQAAVVVLVSLCVARFLDSGVTFSMQFGLQSLLVILMPPLPGGPFTRSLDAICGGLVALILVALWPRDPRRQPAKQMNELLRRSAAVVRDLGRAVAADDGPGAWHALVAARGTQPLVEAAQTELSSSLEISRLSPAGRKHLPQVERMQRMHARADLAVRNIRVVARRTATLLSGEVLDASSRDIVAEALDGMADALVAMASSVSESSAGASDRILSTAMDRLIGVAADLDPERSGADPQITGLIMTIRPLVVDLLETTGLPHDDAVAYLPRLREA